MKNKNTQTPSQKQKMKPLFVYALWTLAITGVVGVMVFSFLNLGIFENVFAAATYTSTTTGGNWTTGSTWTGGSAPGNWSNNTVNINGNVTLAGTSELNGFTLITLNNGKSFTSGTSATANNLSFQNATFNVVNGNIMVYGNLTLNSTAMTITTGSLTVTGILTLTGGSTLISNSSGSISAANLTSSGSGGTLTMNTGMLAVSNTLSINSGTTVAIASGVTVTAASLSLANNSSAILNNNGTVSISGNVSQGGALNNNGTMTVNGNITSTGSGSSIITNTGNLNVSGNVTLPSSGKLYGRPGGKIIVNGNVMVDGNLNLVVGTNSAPPPYSDLVIKKDLISAGSGDVLFDRNSRVAVFGSVTDSGGGGTLFTVNNGGQVYIEGTMAYTGGGNNIVNNNAANPFGFYLNGSLSNTGGGSVTTANKASKAVMQSTNAPFYTWVSSQAAGALPIKLLFFKVIETTKEYITLSWATTMEENFDRFEVQRSADGKTFESLADVLGAGNSKVRLNYSYQDEAPVIGKNYYRLKSIDLDASFEYSGVVSADFESAKELSIFPNPSKGESVNYRINFEPNGDDVISIIDFSGAEIHRTEVTTSSGEIVFNTALKPGTYILKYSSKQFQRAERLIVR